MTLRRLVNVLSAVLFGCVLLAGCGMSLPAPSGPVLTTTPWTSGTTTTASRPVSPVATAAPVVPPTQPAAEVTQPPAPKPTTTQALAAPPSSDGGGDAGSGGRGGDCGSDSYRNVDGACVHDPVQAPAAPPGATAQCRDGSYSFSKHHSGTCSGHGGVAQWLG
jgi:hypothetical protein